MTIEKIIALGKSRSDCSSESIDALLDAVKSVEDVPGIIMEVGSYRCGATIAMSAVTNKAIFAFDLFGGLPYGKGQPFENFGDAQISEIESVVYRFPNIILQPGLHEHTIPLFVFQIDNPVSFVFLDSDFYSSHAVTLKHVWPILSPGGAIVFHDWSFPDVQRAIEQTIPWEETSYWGVMEKAPNMGIIRKVNYGHG